MLPLGTVAVPFSLPDAAGNMHSLDCGGKPSASLIVFMCNHCPYVIHLKAHLSEFCRKYAELGVQVVAINSNDPNYRIEDGPAVMLEDAKKFNYPFPYLVDVSQDVARAYHATCTPDFFLFGRDMRLVYRGQYDSSRPGNGKPVTGGDLGAAIDAVLSGRPVSSKQFPSMGCNIKWQSRTERP